MTNTCTSSSKISVCVCEVTLSDLQNTGDGVYDWALQTYVAVEKLIKDKPASKKVSLALLTQTFTFMRFTSHSRFAFQVYFIYIAHLKQPQD